MLFSGGNKNLVGVGVYWEKLFQVGRGMSKFSAGIGRTFPIPPSRENPVLYENIYSACGYYCYRYYYNFQGGKNREERIFGPNFFSTLLRLLAQVCTMEKDASFLHLFKNWCIKSCTSNQPSLCTKHANLLLIREI